MRSLDIAVTGMSAMNSKIEVTSNNIANMSTTGYSKRIANFQSLIYQTERSAGVAASADGEGTVPTGVQVGLGVELQSIGRSLEQGTLAQTGNAFDLAINGRGYFAVALPNAEVGYTRAGNFTLNSEGVIVTQDGYPVWPEITVPEDASKVSVNSSGQVYAHFDNDTEPQEIGQFDLFTFINEGGMDAVGNTTFKETLASGAPQQGFPGDENFGVIKQGYIENSNVDVVKEITDLITAQRAYEMNSKVIQASDEMMATTSNLR